MNNAVDPGKTRQAREWKHPSPLIGCRLDPLGRFAFASCQDLSILRYELATGKKTVLVGHRSWVRGIAFVRGADLLCTADYTGRIFLWPLAAATPTPLRQWEAHKGWARAVAVSPDGKLLASAGNDHFVKLWAMPEGKLVRTLSGHSGHVYNVAFHPKGTSLVSGDLNGVVKEWEIHTGKCTRDLSAAALHKYDTGFMAHIGGIRGMAFSPDGSLLACAGITEVSNAFAGVGKPLVALFDMNTGKIKQSLVPKQNFQGTAWSVVIHPQGFVAGVGGGNGGALWFWKPDQAQAFFTMSLPNNARDLDLHPSGQQLAIAFADGSLRLYDLPATAPAKAKA